MEKKELFLPKVPIIRIMKIYLILVALTLAKLFASEANAQSISLEVNNVRLKRILNEIERKSDYSFFYNNSIVDVYSRKSLKVENKTLDAVLNELFSESDIAFSYVRNQIILFPKDNYEFRTNKQIKVSAKDNKGIKVINYYCIYFTFSRNFILVWQFYSR